MRTAALAVLLPLVPLGSCADPVVHGSDASGSPLLPLVEGAGHSLLHGELTLDGALVVATELLALVRHDDPRGHPSGERRYPLDGGPDFKRAELHVGNVQPEGYRRYEFQLDWDTRSEPLPDATSEAHFRVALGLYPEGDGREPEYCVALFELVHPLDDYAFRVAARSPEPLLIGAASRFLRDGTHWMPITHAVVGRRDDQVNWQKTFEDEQPRAFVELRGELLAHVQDALQPL